MDYGRFNSVPVWDRKIADWLMPLAPIAQVLLLLTAAFTAWVAVRYAHHPEWQILLLAFIWSP